MNFFNGITNPNDAKSTFRNLAKQYHPDLGGDAELFKELNNAYHALLNSFSGKSFTTEATANNEPKTYRYTYNVKMEERASKLVAAFFALKLQGEISIIGDWVWITGTLFADKEKYGKNGLGVKWNRKHNAWILPGTKSKRSNKSLSEIASTYGQTYLKEDDRKKIS